MVSVSLEELGKHELSQRAFFQFLRDNFFFNNTFYYLSS